MVSNAYLDVISFLDHILDLPKKKFDFPFFMLFSLRNTLKRFLNRLFLRNLQFFRHVAEINFRFLTMMLGWK